MSGSKFGEPWKICADGNLLGIETQNGTIIGVTTPHRVLEVETVRRIVACVNACAETTEMPKQTATETSDTALGRFLADELRTTLKRITKERDDLKQLLVSLNTMQQQITDLKAIVDRHKPQPAKEAEEAATRCHKEMEKARSDFVAAILAILPRGLHFPCKKTLRKNLAEAAVICHEAMDAARYAFIEALAPD